MEKDEVLVAEALAGGPEAFTPIVRQYQSAVFGVAIILLLLTIANRVNSALKQAARPCSPA